jgi:hypothetical protein
MTTKKQIQLFLFGFTTLFLFISCEKKEPICVLPKANVTSNSPVISGDPIILSVSGTGIGSNTTYSWTGPNGFTSTLKNPTILNATTIKSGDYKVIVRGGICESPEASVNVSVINNTVNCTPPDNTASYSGFTNLSFWNISTTTPGSNIFSIIAYATNAHQTIELYNSNPIFSGIYTIVSSTTPLSQNTAHISTSYSGLNFVAKSGDVLVSKVNGKIYAIFCNVPFSTTTTTTTSFNGTSKVIEL